MNNYIKRFLVVTFGIILFIFIKSTLPLSNIFGLYFSNTELIKLFEKYLWLFITGFICLSILSRGQLWSYGINSSNFIKSIKILPIYILVGIIFNNYIEITNNYNLNNLDRIIYYLTFYLAIPVANIVFFIGFIQNYLIRDLNMKEVIKNSFIYFTILFLNYIFLINIIGIKNIAIIIQIMLLVLISALYNSKYNSIFIPLIGTTLALLISI